MEEKEVRLHLSPGISLAVCYVIPLGFRIQGLGNTAYWMRGSRMLNSRYTTRARRHEAQSPSSLNTAKPANLNPGSDFPVKKNLGFWKG